MITLFENFKKPDIIIQNGCIYFYDNNSKIGQAVLSKEQNNCELIGINIFPNYQGMGYFPLLMNTIFDWCKSNNLNKITLDVYKDNNKAIKLYKSFGFNFLHVDAKLGNGFLRMIKYLD